GGGGLRRGETRRGLCRGVGAGIFFSAAAPAAPALAETCDTFAYGGSYTGPDFCKTLCQPNNPDYPNLIDQVKHDKFGHGKSVAPGKFGHKEDIPILPFLVSSCQVQTRMDPNSGYFYCTVTMCGFLQTAT